jgi:hypothetical protein
MAAAFRTEVPMKRKKGWLVAVVVIAVLVGGWIALMNLEYGKTVSLEVNVDPSITSFSLYSVKDDTKPLLTVEPGQDNQRATVTLRIYEIPGNFVDRPVVQYYTFIMEKDGQRFQCTDPFNLYNRNPKLRMNIGMAGSWEIVNR